jgi:hypothetical protein
VVNFKIRLLPAEKDLPTPQYQLNRRLDWLQSFGEEINLLLLRGIKH